MTIKCRTGTEKCSSSQLDTELIDTLVARKQQVRTFSQGIKNTFKRRRFGTSG